MPDTKTTCEYLGDLQLRFSKWVNAPRALVWKAHTDEAMLAQWWGPEGFTHVNEVFDIREGGTWKFMFTGPDGTRYANKILFTELKEPELIVRRHGDYERVHFEARTELTEEEGGTRIVSVMTFPKKETRDATAKFAEPGHASTMRRLDALLATL